MSNLRTEWQGFASHPETTHMPQYWHIIITSVATRKHAMYILGVPLWVHGRNRTATFLYKLNSLDLQDLRFWQQISEDSVVRNMTMCWASGS